MSFPTITRCWTTRVFTNHFHNHPPITFLKASEIIEEVHLAMMDHLMKTMRPIQLHRSLGYIYMTKFKDNRKLVIIDWVKTLKNHKWFREVNHHTNGWIWRIKFTFNKRVRLRVFKFVPLRHHKLELAKRIKNKTIQ